MKWILVVYMLVGNDRRLVELEPFKKDRDCIRAGVAALQLTDDPDGFVCRGPKGVELDVDRSSPWVVENGLPF